MSENDNAMGRIIAKCWQDEAFKNRLIADPAGTLRAEGIEPPDDITLNVVADSDKVINLVIPMPPPELGAEELQAVAAGQVNSWGWVMSAEGCRRKDLC